MAHGYRTELWTTQRIADLIERHLGVHYHRNHGGKLLHHIGWSHQKPERRAIERNEAAIAAWKRSVWPRVKKRRKAGGPPRLD
jgi:transposase